MTRLWLLVLAACSEPTAVVPAQLIHVDVQMTGCTSSCPTPLPLYGVCMAGADRIGSDTTQIEAATETDAKAITGIVELVYSGAVAGGDSPYLSMILTAGQSADARAAGDDRVLYRVDPLDGVTALDRSRLSGASGATLTFTYDDTTEVHTVDKPRPVTVSVYDDDVPCCSTARPSTGALWLLVLTRISARRRCRRARPLRR